MVPRVTILLFLCLLLFAIKSTLAEGETSENKSASNGTTNSPSTSAISPTVSTTGNGTMSPSINIRGTLGNNETSNEENKSASNGTTNSPSTSAISPTASENKSASNGTTNSPSTSAISPTEAYTNQTTATPKQKLDPASTNATTTYGNPDKGRENVGTSGPQSGQLPTSPSNPDKGRENVGNSGPQSGQLPTSPSNPDEGRENVGTSGPSTSSPSTSSMLQKADMKYFWLLLLVGVAGVCAFIYIRCKKKSPRAETTDSGTENASFQRTESNKDGVMLLGVKSSGSEANAAAK
ncbi:uncharacterized protein DDB_G0284671-like isoform X7 [Pygocentrus nattereri]|uniref:uncharacterized protein DDB_G0284671-like isoform X5 n=1 Tax=Pygocentrus nattereri TaxID=42514 RepID=UPI001891F0F9|nr:uncharacterized protein DDB_G0284671-like isoform X5 [Pygocentrus nattereri]XP_037400748.1 uncharacterized protein DDB_G0284671-like isoform X6 [Pygocentrus nattereri]XP_037400750.1 uncharacterized protein DDB_G0284671-like isoform X7 [Pygocentrus nattereri]